MSSTRVGKGYLFGVFVCMGRSEQEHEGSKWDEAGSCQGLEQGKIRLVFRGSDNSNKNWLEVGEQAAPLSRQGRMKASSCGMGKRGLVQVTGQRKHKQDWGSRMGGCWTVWWQMASDHSTTTNHQYSLYTSCAHPACHQTLPTTPEAGMTIISLSPIGSVRCPEVFPAGTRLRP